jgi:site-specific DNA recombinase
MNDHDIARVIAAYDATVRDNTTPDYDARRALADDADGAVGLEVIETAEQLGYSPADVDVRQLLAVGRRRRLRRPSGGRTRRRDNRPGGNRMSTSFTLPPSADLEGDLAAALEGDLVAALGQLPPGQATAVLYLRVSTKDQAERGGEEEGFSIPSQRRSGHRKAAALGATVVKEFIEPGESGKTLAKRPALRKLLAYIAENPVTYVIVDKVDRWARNRELDSLITRSVREAGAQLISAQEAIDETPAGQLLHGIMASIAQFYSDNLAREVIKGSVTKAELGGTPTKAPIGYSNVREIINGREARVVEIDPERGPLMTWALTEIALRPRPIRILHAEVTDKGLRTSPGPKRPAKPLTISQFHRCLRNPYYKGHVVYRGVTYAGTHQPLASAEIWERVQRNLDAQNTAGERKRSHPHYLKGTVYCGRCESRLIITEAKNRHGSIYRYFICVGRHQKRTTCDQSAMRITQVEAIVEDYYATIGLSPDRSTALREYIHTGLSARRADAELERRQQQTLLTKLDHERRKLLQLHYRDAIAPDLFEDEQERITRGMQTATTRLTTIDHVFADIEDTLDHALRLGQNCHHAYVAARPHVRRLMNHAFFQALYISDDDTTRSNLAEPFAILLGDELTREAEAALAQEAKNPPPNNGTTGPTSTSQPHIQHVEGLNKALLVEVMGFEPTTSSMRPKRSSQLSYTPVRDGSS